MLQTMIAPDKAVVTTEGLMKDGAAFQTALALSKMRLFKSTEMNLTENTTKAQLVAAECDYDGYAAGGIAVTALNDPFIDESGGVVVLSPVVQFNYVDDVGHVANTVGGFWLEDAAGVVRISGEFATPQNMAGNTQSVPVVAGRRFTNG